MLLAPLLLFSFAAPGAPLGELSAASSEVRPRESGEREHGERDPDERDPDERDPAEQDRPGQDTADAEAARLERFQTYLDRSPYHERIFDGLLTAAASSGGVAFLIAGYEARVAEDPSDLAGWVLLARLHAHERRWNEAARALRHVRPASARSLWLLGRMELDAGRLEEALIALERARLHATDDPDLADDILQEHAEVMLLRGDLRGARRAYLDLADRDRTDFARLMDTAALLAAANLHDDAVSLLTEARGLVADDVARSCKVLADLGRLRERAHEGDEALACYSEAIALMARGHWLRRELLERSLALHRRAGTLLEAAGEYRRILDEDSADLDARMALVQVLTLAGREREAAALLREATELLPSDLVLSDRYAEALLALGEEQKHTAELQRALELAPHDFERRFDLGRTRSTPPASRSSPSWSAATVTWHDSWWPLEKKSARGNSCVAPRSARPVVRTRWTNSRGSTATWATRSRPAAHWKPLTPPGPRSSNGSADWRKSTWSSANGNALWRSCVGGSANRRDRPTTDTNAPSPWSSTRTSSWGRIARVRWRA